MVAEGLEWQGPCLGRMERVVGVGKQADTLTERTCVCVCVCARGRASVCPFVALCPRVWGPKASALWRGRLVEDVRFWGVGNRWGLNGLISVVAEALVRTLASYEVVTPARVNEFGEVFPQSHHFSRRKRSSEAPEPTPFRTHYRIRAYGQLFQLNLSADAAFLAAGYTEVHLGAPARQAEDRSAVPPDLRHCFYRGQVNAREDNTAVFSICGGLVSTLRPLGIFLGSSLAHSGSRALGFPEWAVGDPRDQSGPPEGLTPR